MGAQPVHDVAGIAVRNELEFTFVTAQDPHLTDIYGRWRAAEPAADLLEAMPCLVGVEGEDVTAGVVTTKAAFGISLPANWWFCRRSIP
jgi:hypothetical protein